MQAEIELGSFEGRGGPAEHLFMALIARIRLGRLAITLPNGGERIFEGDEPGPAASLSVRHPRFFRRLLSGGTVAFAEAYMDGDCQVADLTAFVELAALNEAALGQVVEGRPWVRLLQRLAHVVRPNSKRGSRRNVARHYDLGNAFYESWLDPTMTYSAAVFEHPDQDLAAAQANKYRRMAERAGLQPGHRVLEIGCGWGGFAAWAAREIGCSMTAITISQAQYDYAAQRFQVEGLTDRVDLRLQDYRELGERFDRVVSIEMLEAVGERYWPRFFSVLHDSLRPGGRAALQVITIADDFFEIYRRDADFIQRYIFPGGMLPSPQALGTEARNAGLAWDSAESFGSHYARTLRTWHRSFDLAWPHIATLGFDERFRRMWKYYLAYCEAGFNVGRIDTLQATLSRS